MRFPVAWIVLALCLPLAAQDDLPEGKGKQTLENTCTECHGIDRILRKLRSLEDWRAVAVSMRKEGATMTDAELNTLVEYLFQHFGSVEKLNVNKAAVREIATALRLTVAEATAIVRFREANGPFKEWRDLTKVDGVDKSKIEAAKDRITF